MAEVLTGDVIAYSVTGPAPPVNSGQEGAYTAKWTEVAQCVASDVEPALSAFFPINTQVQGFRINAQSLYDRNKLIDIKVDLDNSMAARCSPSANWRSSIVFVSKVPRSSGAGNPTAPPPNVPPGTPSPPGQKPDMFDELAKQLGVQKETIIWGLAGMVALLVMRK